LISSIIPSLADSFGSDNLYPNNRYQAIVRADGKNKSQGWINENAPAIVRASFLIGIAPQRMPS
jgi:hypothetical protein